MAQTPDTGTILATKPIELGLDLGNAIRWAARERGISRLRLTLDILRRNRNHQGLLPKQYFSFGLHRVEMSDRQRDDFIGINATRALTAALGPPPLDGFTGLLRNKAMTALVLERMRIPTTQIHAVFARDGLTGPWPHLRTAQDIEGFLGSEGALPVYGKPMNGSLSVGIVSIMARAGRNEVVLGDGRTVSAAALAREIEAAYPDGYLFQEVLQPHAELERLSGPALASLRVVTLWDAGGASVLFTAMRLPSPGAMSDDGTVGTGNATLCIDCATGRVERAQGSKNPGTGMLNVAPVTGAPLLGAMLPDWQGAMDLACNAHAVFSVHGLLGFDIALTTRGPVINEINGFPQHSLFQRSSGRGFLNPEIRPRLLAALAARGVAKRGKGMPLP